VIAGFLGGEASVETRAILERGENPFMKSCQLGAANCDLPPDSATMDVDEEMAPALRNRRDLLSRPVNLNGLEEIIGLALGAPEFQRR
jgi:hypothetical protein